MAWLAGGLTIVEVPCTETGFRPKPDWRPLVKTVPKNNYGFLQENGRLSLFKEGEQMCATKFPFVYSFLTFK